LAKQRAIRRYRAPSKPADDGLREQHLPEEAIFFGMDAVNNYQQIRKNIRDGKGSASWIRAIEVGHVSHAGGASGRVWPARGSRRDSRPAEGAGAERHCARTDPNAAAKAVPLKFTALQQKVLGQMAELEKRAMPLDQLNVEYVGLEVQRRGPPSRTLT